MLEQELENSCDEPAGPDSPALVREGMTWKDLRLRALHAAPVELASVSRRGDAAEAEA